MSDVCAVDTCIRVVHRRGLCSKHYQRALRMTNTSNSRAPQAATPLGPCLCDEPKPAVIKWFQGGYADREPRPGDAVECRHCGRPLAAFLA